MKLDLKSEDLGTLILCLQMRICYIETGEVSLRANDAIAMKKPQLIKALNSDQMRAIIGMEDLIIKLQQN